MISKRTFIVSAYDFCTIPAAWFLAYWIRFNFGTIPQFILWDGIKFLPVILFIQMMVFWGFGLYRGDWRFASVPDLIRIIKAVLLGAGLIVIFLFLSPEFLRTTNFFPPRSIIVLYAFNLIGFLAGARLFIRWLKEFTFKKASYQQQNVLIVGAGAAGEALARNLLRDPLCRYKPVVYVDDDPRKKGTEIQGVRVVGPIESLPAVKQAYSIHLVLIALPTASGKVMQKVVDLCYAAQLPYRTLPDVNAVMSGKTTINDLREVSLEDLLGRDPIQLKDERLTSLFEGKTILVSGAGGSIGSELCRQLANFQPQKLILFDHSEYNLYAIQLELSQSHPHLSLVACLQSLIEKEAVIQCLEKMKPDFIFHAAAYKHVPLLEEQVRVAVQNNVVGTRYLAEAAIATNVKKFILISTDKAVNPSNVMGTTKRIAELFCQNYQTQQIQTQFITVRFGNVLGSAGSVVPLFKKQIQEGGPVTVTHPEITRYFMTIPEASQLILQAARMGKGGEIYVLDMGEPVKILDLAKQLIQLSGKKVGEEIQIHISGLRPGEKLYEELFHEQEALEGTEHPKILKARFRKVNWQMLVSTLSGMEQACALNDQQKLLQLMKEIVPEYQSLTLSTDNQVNQTLS